MLTQLHKCRGRFDTFEHALRWLYTVAVSRCIDAHRKAVRKRRLEASVAVRPDAETPSDAQAELHEALRVALEKLPPKFRAVVNLVFFAGLDIRRAASVLGIHRDTVSSRKTEAIDRLRKLIPVATVLATGGTLNVPAALSAKPDPMSATRLTELAQKALKETVAAWPAWTRAALVAGTVLLGGGLAFGGWAMLNKTDPAPTAAVPDRPPDAPPTVFETYQARNLRVFNTDVKPKLEEALRPLAGKNGTVKVVRLRAWDTRFHCEVEIHNRTDAGGSVNFLLGFEYDTASGITRPGISIAGYRKELDPERPLILWRSPVGGKEITVGSEPLRKAVMAFTHLTPDHRTES